MNRLVGWDTAKRSLKHTSKGYSYAATIAIVGLSTLICQLIRGFFEPTNLAMIYLVGVVFVAAQYGRRPSVLASFLSVAAFDFIFVPPFFTFAVSHTQYILTFIAMLFVAITISSLTVRIKEQAQAAEERERRTASLYAMSRELAVSQGIERLIEVAVHHVGDVFDSQAVVLLPDSQGQLSVGALHNTLPDYDPQEAGVAQWVYGNASAAGLNSDKMPGANGLYLPMRATRGIVGVLGIFPRDKERQITPDQHNLLETFANQSALAIERAHLAEETEQAHIQVQMERERNNLLSSISHDLRTPLASITGAASSLLDNSETLDAENRRELAQLAYEEARRLDSQIRNLLQMTRLESGALHINKEWQSLEEVIGGTLYHLGDHLGDHPIEIHLAEDLPLVACDSLLIEQVLTNLLENAAKYTPTGTPIDITAVSDGCNITVEVADRGPGLLPGEEAHVFDKFYRGKSNSAHGVGLGLTICRSIIQAHGGQIDAANRAGGGAVFRFTLPCGGTPPEVESEDGATDI